MSSLSETIRQRVRQRAENRCELCNQYKWTQTEGLDTQSGEIVSLFNPRQ